METTTLASVTYTSAEVWSVFGESLTLLDYNDTVITSAVEGVSVTVGTSVLATPNQVPVCTRFACNGVNIDIHGIVFDQSQCGLTDVFSQTPILFAGALATNAQVYNVTVRESRAAVVVLGGNSVIYTFQPLISANGMTIHDVAFEYGSSSTIPPLERHIVAYFGRAVGTPIVSECNARVYTGWGRLSNCVQYLADTDSIGTTCTHLGECLSSGAPTCCSPDAVITASSECTVGYYCRYVIQSGFLFCVCARSPSTLFVCRIARTQIRCCTQRPDSVQHRLLQLRHAHDMP